MQNASGILIELVCRKSLPAYESTKHVRRHCFFHSTNDHPCVGGKPLHNSYRFPIEFLWATPQRISFRSGGSMCGASSSEADDNKHHETMRRVDQTCIVLRLILFLWRVHGGCVTHCVFVHVNALEALNASHVVCSCSGQYARVVRCLPEQVRWLCVVGL